MYKKDILSWDMVDALAALRQKNISATELTQTYLDEIALKNETWHAYITLTEKTAMDSAKKADTKLAANEKDGGDLLGLPLAIKDLFSTKDIYTTAGSKILADYIPPYESTVTQKLWDAGGVMLGKTNMDEFAMGSTTSTGYHREKKKIVAAVNPYSKNVGDAALTAGGSSGGSAVAVAGQMAVAGIGSDTGGSIRQPCALTGLVGVKPTYGRCSRYGMVAFASSLDQAGVMTRSVRDSALMLSVIAGYDEKDSTSANMPVPKDMWRRAVEKGQGEGLKDLRVLYFYDDKATNPALSVTSVLANHDAKKTLGASTLEPFQFDAEFQAALATYYIIAPAEASSNLSRYDGVRYGFRSGGKNLHELYENTRHDGFGDEVKRRILIGSYVLSAGYYDAYFKKAQQVRRKIAEKFSKLFQNYDMIVLPATPNSAFLLNQHRADPTEIYLQDFFTIPTSLAGLPAGVVPFGYKAGDLPIGLQIISKYYREDILLQAMAAFETYHKNISPPQPYPSLMA
ncbi:MAG: Asp-tRNA(Asn)/Glu-tRNA(Gln) amidotransferase subunit GatA [Alphaproteobacteria bacterium]